MSMGLVNVPAASILNFSIVWGIGENGARPKIKDIISSCIYVILFKNVNIALLYELLIFYWLAGCQDNYILFFCNYLSIALADCADIVALEYARNGNKT